ncbi:MAG: DUF58 domain-containing protein [Polyangiaceae bacterium]|nr:DUF58 domain-containing protein [Polyangiaceae bacterium]
MQLHPVKTSIDLALAGILLVAGGLVLREAAVVAWGGAFLVGLAVARTVTRVSVTRIRAAGFEMVWLDDPRRRRVARGETVEVGAQLRNRDDRAVRFTSLRPVCSPYLEVTVEPSAGEVPASGRLTIIVRVTARRVGRHGVHGLSLEVLGSPGLFEVPLTFANPFGIEVLPRPFATALRSARGGRSRMQTTAGRPGPFSGDGSALRELREHQPGDPFKRIAWRASARRGSLVVRDFEREERDVVWLLLDASVELWAGPPGLAPLDLAVDEVAAAGSRHLAQGDRVGLAVVASRELAWLRPDRGPGREIELCSVLAQVTDTIDADRCDLDEEGVAARVYEHMRPLDPSGAARLRPTDLDRMARRAERLRQRAPMTSRDPFAPTQRERTLRRYLDAFGLGAPPRVTPERPRTDLVLADALTRLRSERPRPSIVYIWSPPLDGTRVEVQRALRKYVRPRVALRWMNIDATASLPIDGTGLTEAVAYAVAERLRVARVRSEQALQRIGLPSERLRKRLHTTNSSPSRSKT